jgi:hypothetical protein
MSLAMLGAVFQLALGVWHLAGPVPLSAPDDASYGLGGDVVICTANGPKRVSAANLPGDEAPPPPVPYQAPHCLACLVLCQNLSIALAPMLVLVHWLPAEPPNPAPDALVQRPPLNLLLLRNRAPPRAS